MSRIKKAVTILTLILTIFISLFHVELALAENSDLGNKLGISYANNVGLPAAANTDVRDMAVTIIKYLITFLGIIAVAIILYGGFIWMTAAGNDDRVTKAKNIIIAGVIGLAVIIAAFAIVNFVINMSGQAINGDFD